MKKRQCTEEQIVRVLQQAQRGEQTIGAVCREHGIAEHTFARSASGWWQKFGGLGIPRLRELEKEHACLKRLLAERRLELDAGALRAKELLAKNTRAPKRWAGAKFLIGRGLSMRQACYLLGLSLSRFYVQPRPSRNTLLVERLQQIARTYPRYGYRRACAVLRRDVVLNHKQVYRLWKHRPRSVASYIALRNRSS